MKKIEYIKPGVFSKSVPTDSRRKTFDFYNESIICTGKKPDVLFIGDSITELWVRLYVFAKNTLNSFLRERANRFTVKKLKMRF